MLGSFWLKQGIHLVVVASQSVTMFTCFSLRSKYFAIKMLNAARILFMLSSFGLSAGNIPTRLTVGIYDGQHEVYVLDFSSTNGYIYTPLKGFAVNTAYQFKGTTDGDVDTWNWNIDWGFHKASGSTMTYTFLRTGVFNVQCEAVTGAEKLKASINLQVLTQSELNPRIRSMLSVKIDDPVAVNRNADLEVTLLSTLSKSKLDFYGSRVKVRLAFKKRESESPENVDRIYLDCEEYQDKENIGVVSGQEGYKLSCSAQHITAFSKQSLYSINASLEHEALDAEVIHTVCVKSDISCQPPILRIQVPNPTVNQPSYDDAPLLRFRPDESIHLFSNIIRDSCLDLDQESNLEFEWNVIRMSDIRRLTGPLTSQTLQDIPKVNLTLRGGFDVNKVTDFFLPAHILDLGSYLVVFSATEVPYCGPSPVFEHDYVRLDVLPRLISATIRGGSYREWRPMSDTDNLELDGSATFLENEETSEDIRIKWICSLSSQRNVAKGISNWNDVLELQGESTGGCFGSGFILGDPDVVSDSTSSTITVLGSRISGTNKRFLFSLLVYRVSTSDLSVFEQEVVVRPQEANAAQLSLECIANCGRSVSKNQAVTLKGACIQCNRTLVKSEPQWQLLLPDKTKQTFPGSLSRENSSILILSPGALKLPGEYTVEATITPKTTKGRQNALATARYKFVVPTGPSTGFCQIYPESGVSLITRFVIDCENFVDPNPPLIFAVSAIPARLKSRKSEVVLLYQGMSTTVKDIILPPGYKNFGYRVKVKITTTNKIGRTTSISYYVTVTPPDKSFLISSTDSLIHGNRSLLAHMLKGGNVDGANALISSALETASREHLSAEKRLRVATDILEQVAQQAPKSAKNAYQYTSTLALITNASNDGRNEISHDDKQKIADSVKSVISKTLQSDYMNVFTPDVNEYVVPALNQAAEAVSNVISLPSSKRNVALQTSLLGVREKVLGELFGRVGSGEVVSTDKEQVRIAKLSPIRANAASVGTSNDWGAGVVVKDFAPIHADAALSTLFYNPFPVASTSADRLQLPVVGLSFLGNVSVGDGLQSGRSRTSEYDVFIPLNSAEQTEGTLGSSFLASVVLPPACSKYETNATSRIINETNACGAVTVNVNISTSSALESPETFAYLVMRPKFRCRVPKAPCIGITFSKQGCTGQLCLDKASLKFVLPRVENSVIGDVADDKWSLPLGRDVLNRYGQRQGISDWTQFSLMVENLQDDLSVRLDDDEQRFQQVQISIIKPQCLLWDYDRSTWSSSSCSAGRLVEKDRLLCRCIANSPKSTDQGLPFLITGGLIILPNQIDFHDMVNFLGRLKNNPYVIVAVCLWWFVFVPAFIWARRKDERDEKLRHFHIPEDSDPEDKHLYEVVVFTGLLNNAGTTANVTLSLEGDNGAVSDMHVITDVNKKLLRRGGVDTFLITSRVNLGKVTTVRLWHDNTGTSPRWFLNRVAVYDLCSGTSPSLFLANSWLSLDIAPFLCRIELHESYIAQLTSFKTMLRNSLLTQAQITNVWLAPFHRAVCSTFTRVQRVACCMVAVFSCMLASIMFFNTEGSSHYQLSLGYVSVDLSPLIAAAEAALFLAPVNVLVNFIFRNILPREQDTEAQPSKCDETVSVKNDSMPQAIPRRFTITNTANIVENQSTAWWIMQCFIPSPNKIPLPSSHPPLLGKNPTQFRTFGRLPRISRLRYKRNVIAAEVLSYRSIISDLKEIRDIAAGISLNSLPVKLSAKRSTPLPATGNNLNEKTFSKDNNFESDSFDGLTASDVDVSLSSKKTYNNFPDEKYSPDSKIPSFRGILANKCHALAWMAMFVHLIATSSFTVLYGIQYGSETFLRWVLAFVLSVAQNMLVVTPVRILCVATLTALASRGVVNLRDWEGFTEERIRQNAVARWRDIALTYSGSKSYSDHDSASSGDATFGPRSLFTKRAAEIAKRPWCYEQPTFEQLIEAGKLKVAVAHVRRYWFEAVAWAAIIIIATAIIGLQQDSTVVRLDQHVRGYFMQDFDAISRGPDALEFLEKHLVPRLYGVEDGPRISYEFYLIGPIRLRQVRLLPVKCQNIYNVPYKNTCKLSDAMVQYPWQYDTLMYRPFWHVNNKLRNTSAPHFTPWEYSSLQGDQDSLVLTGNSLRRSYYPSGGYTVDLGYSNEEVGQTLRSLRNAFWVNSDTAALFIEYSIHTPNLQYVTSVTLVVELLAQGGVNLYKEVNTYRPTYLYSTRDITLVVLRVLHVIACIGTLVDLVIQCRMVRWKAQAVFQIATDFWNAMSLLVVALTFSAYGVYFYSVYASATVSRNYKLDPGRYAPFYTPAHYAKVHLLLLGFSTFFSHIRFLKVFRASQLVSVMLYTFSSAWKELLSVTLVIAAFLVAFGHAGNMSFSSRRHDFKSPRLSFTTLYSLSAGLDAPHPLRVTSTDVLWAFFFASYMILVIAVLLNLYTAVIDDTYREMRQKAKGQEWHPVENLAVAWLYERVLSLFGIASSQFKDAYLQARESDERDSSSLFSFDSLTTYKTAHEDKRRFSSKRISINQR